MTNRTLEKQIEHRLSEHEVRFTTGRRAVIEQLATAEGPLSASELHSMLSPAIPLSSLYRTLTVLEETGVLMTHFGQGVTRYELAEWLTGHHHHLICIECGTVEDVELGQTMEHKVDDVVATITAGLGFNPIDHTLEIEGRCARCQ